VIAEVRDRSLTDKSKNVDRETQKQSFLVFDAGKNSRMAIPLSAVARLEEFPRQMIERSGGQEVVQYRGNILPLIQVSNYLADGGETISTADPLQVVVYSELGRSVGLVVGKISDIVEEVLTVKRDVKREGIAGSAVIQDKVTDLLDVPGIIRAADPTFYSTTQENV